MKSRTFLTIMLAILIGLSAAGCGTAAPSPEPTSAALPPVANPPGIDAEGRLEPVRFAELSIATSGSVSKLPVAEGEEVETGQVIAQVQSEESRTLEAAQASAALRLAEAYQDVRDTQNKLDDFAIPAKFAGLTAEQAARQALANLQAARDAFEPYKDSSVKGYRLNRGFPSLPTYIYVDTEVYKDGVAKELKKRLTSAWIDYRRAVMWLDMQSALETAQAQVVQAQEDVANLQDSSLAEDTAGARAALANAELRAPFAGTVTNLHLKVGQSVAAGDSAVTVADFSSWVVKTTDLTEIDVVKIQEGQPVTLTLDAIPGETLNGYVRSIAENYAERQGDVVYEVTILLTDNIPGMRWGMTAKLHFIE